MNKTHKAKGWDRYEARRKLVPGGAGTLSKAPLLAPDEPALIARGAGCRIWDVDDNEYIDFRCALGPVTLGYRNPAVDEAITRQLQSGIAFGHPHPSEAELAEALVNVIPCAGAVRFLKTGGEAMAALIKLARASTGRAKILSCGYHGWLGTVHRTEGVLPQVSREHLEFVYGDLEGVERLLHQHRGEIAAVTLAGSYAMMYPDDPFPKALRALTQAHGVLLVIDEIVTGFRLRIGGYHEYYGFEPDLAAFSKGIANGMPLSVFCGRPEIMERSADRAVVSSTFSGEALSIAAARAVLDVYQKEKVIDHLWQIGERFQKGLDRLFAKHGLPISTQGLPPCFALAFDQETEEEKTRLQRALFRAFYRHGVSMYYVCYVNLAHREEDVDEALSRIDAACSCLDLEGENLSPVAAPAIGALANLGR